MELKLHVRKNQNIALIQHKLHRFHFKNHQLVDLHLSEVKLFCFNRHFDAKKHHNLPICHFFRREKRTLFSLKSSFSVLFSVLLRVYVKNS